MFDLTTQTNNSTLQAGLIAIKMKLHTLSIINGTMIENVTKSQQNKFIYPSKDREQKALSIDVFMYVWLPT